MPLCETRVSPCSTLDVLERHAELVGDDLAPRRLVALAVRGRAGDHLDLAGGQHPDRHRLPAAGAVAQRAEHPRRRQPAHLGVGGDADAELHRVVRRPPARLLGPQLVVAEQLHRLVGGRLVVAGVVDQPGTVVNGNSSCLIQLRRRTSIGSRPSSAASSSMMRSMAYVASGRPAPR